MSKPKPPAAPDPKVTAGAQTGTNVTTALANAQLGNVNRYGPDGSTVYSETGQMKKFTDPSTGYVYEIPQYNETTTLSPQQQAIKQQTDAASLNLGKLANSQSGRLNNLLGTPFNLNGLPQGGNAANLSKPNYQQFGSGPDLATSFANSGDITKTYGTDFSADRQRVEDAMFERANPQLERDRTALETSLVNQGIRRGSSAWEAALDEHNRGVNDQRTSILLGAGQEQSRLAQLEAQRSAFQNSAQQQQFTQDYARGGFANDAQQQMYANQNTAIGGNNALQDQLTNWQLSQFNAQNQQRQNALTERYAERNQPLNEIASLMNGAPVQSPQFGGLNMPSIPTTDYAGIVQQDYANRMGAYNQQTAQRNSILGGLFGLGASVIGASDRRLKRDIRRIGTYPNGLGRYSYRYRWSRAKHIGVMSDEVRKVRPDAVISIDGFDAVNYRKALA